MIPPPCRTFELTVRPQSQTQRWHVLLRELERSVSLEFDDPQTLVRFLEQLQPDERPLPRGLR